METTVITPDQPGWLTKGQLAHRYQCCRRTINNLMSRRILPYRKIGNILRFDPRECDKAMDAFKVKSIALREM